MDNLDYVKKYLKNSLSVKERLSKSEDVLENIAKTAAILVQMYKNGKKVMIAGNGGSAADAQHIAAEFVSRFFFDRPGLPALALTTDTSMLTAIGNDYGFENIFARQLQAQSCEGDVFIGISTSGNSKNIVNAVKQCSELGVRSIVLCGESGLLRNMADIAIQVPSESTPHIQECHICIGHIICAIVEKTIFSEAESSV